MLHYSMKEIESKDWSKMQAYFEWNKDKFKNALEKMATHTEFDFKQMYFDDPILFVFFVNIHEKEDNSYDREIFWNLRCKAYYQLKKDDFFNTNISLLNLKILQEFELKVAGPCLLSAKQINSAKTTTKKLKEKSVFFNYHEIIEMIETAYSISVRGFFDEMSDNEKKKIYHQYFPDANYDEVGRTSPVASLEANYLSLISDYFYKHITYVDFWHYLLDSDFENISNGCIATFYANNDEAMDIKEAIKSTSYLKKYIFFQIKSTVFKELSQLKDVGSEAESIEFNIRW